jgi:hypothetical protein
MSQDPSSVFGSLLRGCIRDRYVPIRKSEEMERLLFVLLGLLSSVATTYLLSAVGFLV